MALKTPSGALSTAEAIAVMVGGLSQAAYFDDGKLDAGDARRQHARRGREGPGAGHGRAASEYLETVLKKRRGFERLSTPRLTRRDLTPWRRQVSLFGIRHHGPGSARRLVQALDDLKPAAVLIEGPRGSIGRYCRCSPIPRWRRRWRLLIYAEDNPANASFFPFAEYSPEYQARAGRSATAHRCASSTCRSSDRLGRWPAAASRTRDGGRAADDDPISRDPIGALAAGRGLRGWRDLVVRRDRGEPALGAGVRRGRRCDDGAARRSRSRSRLARPRARRICGSRSRRRAKGVRGPIAVVCGAWHVPALIERRSLAAERDSCSRGGRRRRSRRPGRHGPRRAWRGRAAMAPAWSRPAGARICGRRATAPIAARCGLPGSRTCCAIAGISSRPPR